MFVFGPNADVGHLPPLLRTGSSFRGALIGPGPYGLLTQLYYSTNSPRRREGEVMLRTMIAGLLAACCAVGAAGAQTYPTALDPSALKGPRLDAPNAGVVLGSPHSVRKKRERGKRR